MIYFFLVFLALVEGHVNHAARVVHEGSKTVVMAHTFYAPFDLQMLHPFERYFGLVGNAMIRSQQLRVITGNRLVSGTFNTVPVSMDEWGMNVEFILEQDKTFTHGGGAVWYGHEHLHQVPFNESNIHGLGMSTHAGHVMLVDWNNESGTHVSLLVNAVDGEDPEFASTFPYTSPKESERKVMRLNCRISDKISTLVSVHLVILDDSFHLVAKADNAIHNCGKVPGKAAKDRHLLVTGFVRGTYTSSLSIDSLSITGPDNEGTNLFGKFHKMGDPRQMQAEDDYCEDCDLGDDI